LRLRKPVCYLRRNNNKQANINASESAMGTLDQTQLERMKATLQQRHAALLQQLKSDAETAAEQTPFATEIEASPADNASVRTLNELTAEATEHKMAQLQWVAHALSKFAINSYGTCESCGEAISWSRLQARPEARYCIACQTSIEKSAKSH
jgi:DnaK suppressor protein